MAYAEIQNRLIGYQNGKAVYETFGAALSSTDLYIPKREDQMTGIKDPLTGVNHVLQPRCVEVRIDCRTHAGRVLVHAVWIAPRAESEALAHV